MSIDLFFECVKSDEILDDDKYNYDYEIDKTLLKHLLKKKVCGYMIIVNE